VTHYSVSIDADALVDIEKAKNWYYNQSPAHAERFHARVLEGIYSLGENPALYATRYGRVRCIRIGNFPFKAFFVLDDFNKTVNILNVLHKNRSAKHWPRS
jgi:plasmid stabilization system protein ParE